MKKSSGTDIFDHMSEDEVQRILALKSGLEDLNLIMHEIEHTYELMAETGLSEAEQKNQKIRLQSLEKFLNDINAKVNNALGTGEDRIKLS